MAAARIDISVLEQTVIIGEFCGELSILAGWNHLLDLLNFGWGQKRRRSSCGC